MYPCFAVFREFGLLRTILEFCRDNERVFYSHTCKSARKAAKSWIPAKDVYRTLTRPKILPELFDEKNGVYSVELPKPRCDFHFLISMLGQTDIHNKGVLALKWFQLVSGVRPTMDTKRVLMLKFLIHDDDSLSDRQVSILKTRFAEARDRSILVHDRRHWEIVLPMMKTNSSIRRFLFYRPASALNEEMCYADVFRFLSSRECSTEYLDLSGRLSAATLNSFHLLAWGLTGMMLRRLSSDVIVSFLDTIMSRPNEAQFTCMQFDELSVGHGAENAILEVLDTLPMETLLLRKITFPERGFSRIFATIGNSNLATLHIRRCELSSIEITQCLFLPTVADSSLTKLVLSGVLIPEEAAGALAFCVEESSFLRTLVLDGCGLGPKCVEMLVVGLKKSSLTTLNLGKNKLGEVAHRLFKNVGHRLTMINMILDLCSMCSNAVKDYRWAQKQYAYHGMELHVSLRECELVRKNKS